MINKILLFVGPSGSGKTTCLKALVASMPDHFGYVPSLTTRPPRPDEQHGKDYFFVTDEVFDKTDLVQQALFDNHRYGVSRKTLDGIGEFNKIPTLSVTEEGVQQFIDAGLYPIVIRVNPYNFVPREGREAADLSRPPLPTNTSYTLHYLSAIEALDNLLYSVHSSSCAINIIFSLS